MHEKIWNYKVSNTLLWKDIMMPLHFRKIKFQLKWNKESVINIEGPHYLENISGIVIYALAFCTVYETELWMYDIIKVWQTVLFTDARKAEFVKEEEKWI